MPIDVKYPMRLICCLLIVLIGVSYFGYYLYRQNTIHLKEPEGFSVECETDSISLVGEKWLKAYTDHTWQNICLPAKIIEYVLMILRSRKAVIQVDFWVVPARLEENTASGWNGF